MKLVDWYSKTTETKKNLFLLGMVTLSGFIALSIFFFTGNPGVPLGWLFGSAIEIICYITIVKGASFMLDPNSLSRKKSLLVPLFVALRLSLYGGGLILSAFATFRWGSMSCSYLNIWSTFAAYLPLYVILSAATIYRLKKQQAEAPKAELVKHDDNGEEND